MSQAKPVPCEKVEHAITVAPSASGKASFRGWPVVQPTLPNFGNFNCTCFTKAPHEDAVSFTCGAVFILAPVLFAVGLGSFVVLAVSTLVFLIILGLPVCLLLMYIWSWWMDRSFQPYAGIFTKLAYVFLNIGLPHTPKPIHDVLKVEKLAPKGRLLQHKIQFGLNISVPSSTQAQYQPESQGSLKLWFMEHMYMLPFVDFFQEFEPHEDPVKWMMARVGNIYPSLYDKWEDKLSDDALVRFCFNAVGAHRIETVLHGERAAQKHTEDGREHEVEYYVLRTNALRSLTVREGFGHYGGDCYFFPDFRPAFIITDEAAPTADGGSQQQQQLRKELRHRVVYPHDGKAWEFAKFRFRSSVMALVTVVDHLYGLHLFVANQLTVVVRECLSSTHPVRRFLTPFQFRTIAVNDNARMMLIKKGTLAQRTFAFDEQGLSVAMNAAPQLLAPFSQALNGAGYRTAISKARTVDWLKDVRKLDTPFLRQQKRLYEIHLRFARRYLRAYYGSGSGQGTGQEGEGGGDYLANMCKDPELMDCFFAYIAKHKRINPTIVPPEAAEHLDGHIEPKDIVGDIEHHIASFMFDVTAGHEQAGAVGVYGQDGSFTAGKWRTGSMCGTKQSAIAVGMLVASTSGYMPSLMQPISRSGDDALIARQPRAADVYENAEYTQDATVNGEAWAPWDYLYTDPRGAEARSHTGADGAGVGADEPKKLYWEWMRELQHMSVDVDTYNTVQEMAKRPFPWNMPVYTNNPKFHDCSVSV